MDLTGDKIDQHNLVLDIANFTHPNQFGRFVLCGIFTLSSGEPRSEQNFG